MQHLDASLSQKLASAQRASDLFTVVFAALVSLALSGGEGRGRASVATEANRRCSSEAREPLTLTLSPDGGEGTLNTYKSGTSNPKPPARLQVEGRALNISSN
jgi:hypothetical protein